MRRPFLFAIVAFAGASGCTTLLGDYEVAGTPGGADAGSCTTQCNGKCADLTQDNANCGACGTACTNGQTCQASKCACPPDQAFCGGQCGKADRQHCGASCAPCQSDEICASGCVTAPTPTFKTVPRDPTGWVLAPNNPLTIELTPVNAPGVIYECRTGPDAKFTPSEPAWGPCDGGPGTGTVHKPAPDSATPEGTYRTEYRYRSDTYRSPPASVRYYIHHALDKAATCPRAGQAGDGPHFTDDQYFQAAKDYSLANLSAFPTTDTFATPSNPPARTDDTYLISPFIRIKFKGVAVSKGMKGGGGPGWPIAGGDYVMNERTLRHKYVMNAARTLILYKRMYAHPKTGDCKNVFDIGSKFSAAFGPTEAKRAGRHREDCEALVLNSHGVGLCLAPNAAGTAPEAKAIDLHTNIPGSDPFPNTLTVAVTSGSANITLSAAPNGGYLNSFLQIPANTGRWYKVAAQTDGTHYTLAERYQSATATGLKFRTSGPNLIATTLIPTGYAKLHADGHTAAAGLKAPGTPSQRTKCETPGCNTNKPWLTYLPP